MDDYNLGPGDIFYDRKGMRSESWGESITSPLSTLVILSATKGKYAAIEYRIDHWDCIKWQQGIPRFTTQLEIKNLLTPP